MFEPLTLRMPELAERWKMTPIQALEFAEANGLPIYFNFSGLAFFDSNEWCRTHGDQDIRRELTTLNEGIAKGESWFARRSRGETGKYDCLTDQEAQELRQSIEASKRRIKAIKELLEQRQIDRKRYRYSGPMGAGGQTLFEVRQSGKSGWPRFGIPPGRNEVIFLEYFTDSCNEPLTIDSLFVVLREVKAGEIYFKAKQAAPVPQAAPVVTDSASTAPAKRWTTEKLAEVKAYREKHGTKKTAAHYQVSEARIRELLPGDKPKPKGFSAFTHRMK